MPIIIQRAALFPAQAHPRTACGGLAVIKQFDTGRKQRAANGFQRVDPAAPSKLRIVLMPTPAASARAFWSIPAKARAALIWFPDTGMHTPDTFIWVFTALWRWHKSAALRIGTELTLI